MKRWGKLIAILPDQQCPYHDPQLHELVLQWLRVHRPDSLILSGDLIDLPMVSRHPRKKHELNATIEEALEATKGLLDEYARAAGKDCKERWLIPGNHEQRLQSWIMRTCPEFARISDERGEILNLPRLLGLQERGYEWAGDPVYSEDWPHGHVTINKHLAVYHGWLARRGAGASALASLDHLGHSVIVGHTHRQAIVSHTYHEIDGRLRVLRGVEAGTLARVRGGLGYALAPNWQPGFATVQAYPDDTFNVQLATFVNGVLLWGGEQYGKANT